MKCSEFEIAPCTMYMYLCVHYHTNFTQHKKYELQSLNMHGYPTKTNVIKDVIHLFSKIYNTERNQNFHNFFNCCWYEMGQLSYHFPQMQAKLDSILFSPDTQLPICSKGIRCFLATVHVLERLNENHGEVCYKGLPCCLSDVWFTT